MSTVIDSIRRVIRWSRFGEQPAEISFDDLLYIQTQGSSYYGELKLKGKYEKIVRTVLVSGEAIEFSDVIPGIDWSRRIIHWSPPNGGAGELPLDDVVNIQIQGIGFEEAAISNWSWATTNLRSDEKVLIKPQTRSEFEGRFLSRTDSTLSVVYDQDIVDIPQPEIEKLWVLGRATKSGAETGAVIGLVGGAVVGVLVAEYSSNESVENNGIEGAIIGSLVGAGLLGLLGAVIGEAVPQWNEIYESPSYEQIVTTQPDRLELPRFSGQFRSDG